MPETAGAAEKEGAVVLGRGSGGSGDTVHAGRSVRTPRTPPRLPRPLADGMIVGAVKETARWLAMDDRKWHQVRDAARSCCSALTIQELYLALVIYLPLYLPYRTVYYLSQFDVKITRGVICKKRLPKAETWARHVLLSGVCDLRVKEGEMSRHVTPALGRRPSWRWQRDRQTQLQASVATDPTRPHDTVSSSPFPSPLLSSHPSPFPSPFPSGVRLRVPTPVPVPALRSFVHFHPRSRSRSVPVWLSGCMMHAYRRTIERRVADSIKEKKGRHNGRLVQPLPFPKCSIV